MANLLDAFKKRIQSNPLLRKVTTVVNKPITAKGIGQRGASLKDLKNTVAPIIKEQTSPFVKTGKIILGTGYEIPRLGAVKTAQAIGDTKRAMKIASVQNPFLSTKEQQEIMANPKKAIINQARNSAGILSWAVPFGKARAGAGIIERGITKSILPGAVAGGTQAATMENATPSSIAKGAMFGAGLAGFLHGTGKAISGLRGGVKTQLPQELPQSPLLSPTEVGLPSQAQKGVSPTGEATDILGRIQQKLQGLRQPGLSTVGKEEVALADSISLNDPIKKITALLQEAKPMRGQQEALYSAERSRRAGAIAGIGKSIPGEKGFYAQLGKLKGELPKVEFSRIRQGLSQPDIDSLYNKVEGATMTPFEKINAKSALNKLLGVEGGQIPTESELKLLGEVFPQEMIQAVLDKRPFMQKLFSATENALNVPRSAMATLDLSAPFRQGFLMVGRPKQFFPALKDMFKYAASEDGYMELMTSIKNRPTYLKMREGKLALTDIGENLGSREEAFLSNLPEKLPILGRLARGSNRAYTGFLNKLRADVFDDLVMKAEGQGRAVNGKLLEDIATFVNTATGRGNLGKFQGAAKILNATFFSPRLLASRINTLNPLYYAKLDPFVRKEALKTLLSTTAIASTVLGLAKIGGADVQTDPRSADFAKIKIGNTRYDVLGGYQQYIRLVSQLLTGKIISSTTGKEITLGEGYKPMTRKDILIRFFEGKESPIASFVTNLVTGKTGTGDDVNIPAEVISRFIPLIVQDIYDLQKEWGPKGVLMAIPGAFGFGSQTYGGTEIARGIGPLGKKTIEVQPYPGLPEKLAQKIPFIKQPPLMPGKSWTIEKFYQDLKSKPQEEKAAILSEISTTNPKLFKQIQQVAKDEKLGITVRDKELRDMGVSNGARSQKIIENLSKLQTPEEKKKYMQDLVNKGILTTEVLKQVAEQMSNKTSQTKPKSILSALNPVKEVSAAELTPQEKQASITDAFPVKVSGDAQNITNKVVKAVPIKSRVSAQKSIPSIIQALKDEGIDDPRTIAYALATIEHETAGTFAPIAEYGGRQQARRLGYKGGENYYGRGFIQLTHDYNYREIGKRIGMGDKLVKNPDLALQPEVAAKILAVFFKDRGVARIAKTGNFYKARGPVNGTDKADKIAKRAKQYLSHL